MRDKQIEEMVKHCHFYEDGNCNLCEELWVECDAKCDMCEFAKQLYNAGYRKSTDVAREIVTEFANMLKCHSFYMSDEYGEVNELVITVKAINEIEAELKKKYESESTNEP